MTNTNHNNLHSAVMLGIAKEINRLSRMERKATYAANRTANDATRAIYEREARSHKKAIVAFEALDSDINKAFDIFEAYIQSK